MTNTDILKGERRRIIEQIREEVKAEVLERVQTLIGSIQFRPFDENEVKRDYENRKYGFNKGLQKALEVIEKELLGKE